MFGFPLKSIWVGIKAFAVRLFWECFKVAPYFLMVVLGAWYLGDFSQLQLAGYWLTIICMTVLVTHVGRKFMYPSVSIETYCKAALENNMAAALIVVAFLAFQILISWLVVICVTSMMAAPPKFSNLQGLSGGNIEQAQPK